jgi:predicted phosphodiesterase
MPHKLGDRLFTFAVVTDTHVNFGERECNSEFEVNKGANGRLRHVIHDLNRRDLAFVIHLGDVVHPVPALPDLYERAAERFREQVADLRHPLHLVPGNHDIGDKPIVWGPGGVVCDTFIDLWKKNFGPNYQDFDHGDCRFFLVDAQIINSGLAAEAEQIAWLEAGLAEAVQGGKRIYLSTHYPPFLTDPEEDEHFDNIAEPGRSWLLGLMDRHRAEALFSGHVHNIWYNRYGVTDCYALPSTAFVRQDYAEIYRATPPPETDGGRSDLAKLGYFLVQVHEDGHFSQWIRTFGKIAEPGSATVNPGDVVAAIHPLENPNTRFGFDMRQNWLEIVEIPPSGSLDEFDRKRTRNDYALMAVLEMGVRRLRIPARDLLDPDHRRRLDDCARQGLLFTLFTFGVPDQRLLTAVTDARDLIDCWEISHRLDDLPRVAQAATDTALAAGVSLYLSKIRTKEDAERGGGIYHHMISHGFTPEDRDQIAEVSDLDGIDGVVFRVDGTLSPWRAAREAAAVCRGNGLKMSLHIRMTIGKPGAVQSDDDWVAKRVAESLAAAAAYSDIHVYPDTFADVDRGYFRRHGVVDRFYNPRKAFHVARYLNAALAGGLGARSDGIFTPIDDGTHVSLMDGENRRYHLMSPDGHQALNRPSETGLIVDLLSGERSHGARTTEGQFKPPLPSHHCLWVPDSIH